MGNKVKFIKYLGVFVLSGATHYLITTKLTLMRASRLSYLWEQALPIEENSFDRLMRMMTDVLLMPGIILENLGIASKDWSVYISIISYAFFGTLVFWVASRVFKW
jgi:hypothetical protein